MPEYIKGQTGYSDGAGGTISYGHQFGNGGRTASLYGLSLLCSCRGKTASDCLGLYGGGNGPHSTSTDIQRSRPIGIIL